ncbi:MAG: hypothetical protein GY851_10730 [bacterium]|nr:hypothetical protein [bacterium]
MAEWPGARNEYEGYVPQAFMLLINGTDADRIAEYLVAMETGPIGLTSDGERARRAAAALVEWRAWVFAEDRWSGRA